MEIIRIWNNKASYKQIEYVGAKIKSGEIGIIPTDTMYAIVADALNMKAIEKVCRLKGINPEKTNLSIICSDISMAAEYTKIDNTGFRMLKDYCPGPFTFLFKSASKLPRAFKGRKIVGVRIPDCPFDLELVSHLGNPLLTTSIEFEDEDYALNPALIAEAYEGKINFMAEGEEGTTEVSTIVDCVDGTPTIIREGKGVL